MSEPQPIRFSVPEDSFDLSLLPEAARQRGSEAFREAVTRYYKDAYREAGGRVDVAFSEGLIEVAWEPQAGQVPASATIAAMSAPPSQIPVLLCIPLSCLAPMGLTPTSAATRVPRVDPWAVDARQTGACRRLSA